MLDVGVEVSETATGRGAVASKWTAVPGPLKLGGGILAFILVVTWVGPLAYHQNPFAINYLATNEGASWLHPLGTDSLGRDVLSRVLFGGRITLGAAVGTAVVGGASGTVIGLLAGFWPRLDMWIMRLVDLWMSFPFFVLAMAFVAILGPSIVHASLAVAIAIVPGFVRVVRADVLKINAFAFVEAEKAMGSGPIRIVGKHVLPNVLPTLATYAPLQIGGIVLTGFPQLVDRPGTIK